MEKQEKLDKIRQELVEESKVIATKKKASKGKQWTQADEIKLISQDKIDILDHTAAETVWVGAKDAGKSRPVIVRKRTMIETNKDAYGLDLKKYKLGGVARLHNALNNINLEVKSLGYETVDYEAGINKSYRLVNKSQKTKNQSIEYGSFDDANGLAGIEAPNNGFFGLVQIEEPVLIDDPGKTPTRSEWNAALKTIKDSVNRSNRKYAMISKKPVVAPKYHFTMNAWDKEHPLIEDINEFFPESEFAEFFIKDLINNHTDTRFDPRINRLYVRLTKFANPVIRLIESFLLQNNIKTLDDWRNVSKASFEAITASYPEFASLNISYELIEMHLEEGLSIYERCQEAIANGDSLELARLLGLTYEGETSDKKVYDLSLVKLSDTDKILENLQKWARIENFSLAYDVDTREGRGFVGTPVYHIVQQSPFDEIKEIIIVGKQFKIASFGDKAALVDYYKQQLINKNDEIREKVIKIAKKDMTGFLYVDENRANYLTVMQDGKWIIGKAQKHGQWDILHRQDYLQIMINQGKIIIDQDNIKLIADLKKAIAKEGSRQRDESGKLEKDFDFINAMEYSLYPFRTLIYNDEIPILEFENML